MLRIMIAFILGGTFAWMTFPVQRKLKIRRGKDRGIGPT